MVGNVLGGNLFIALGGGALVGLFSAGPVASPGNLPLVLMVAVVVVAWLAMGRGRAVPRWQALALLLAYLALLPIINR